MASPSSYITNEIIITAMDRFVWFVLLVVMSHLVTEFTRVTGYARGNRQELVLVNESLIEPKSVHNMVLYPGLQEYALYEPAPPSYYYQNSNNLNAHPYISVNSMQQQQQPQPQPQSQQPNAEIIMPSSGTQQAFTFSFRPLIDSIFDIPISALRAVNNLVARLTGSYQTPSTAYSPQKTASLIIETQRSNSNNNNNNKAYSTETAKTTRSRRYTLPEEIA